MSRAVTYRHAADRERYHSFAVAVNDAADITIAFVDLAMDESLYISFGRVFPHRRSIFDVILLEVLAAGDKSRGKGARDEECRRVLRVADTDMPVRIENVLVVEDVVRRYQRAEELIRRRRRGFEKRGA